MNKIVQQAEIQAQLPKMALRANPGTPEELAAAPRKDYVRDAKMTKLLNLRLD